MGTWGAGIFQSDDALDFLDEFVGKLERIIVYHLADEALTGFPPGGYEAAVAAVDILALWCEHYHTFPNASVRVVRQWRSMTLQQFEADANWNEGQTVDSLDARAERRHVIEAAKGRLEAVAHDENKGPDHPPQ